MLLWTIGWIVIFPVPLTLLLKRNPKMKKGLKVSLAVAGWILFIIWRLGMPGDNNNKQSTLNKNETETLIEKVTETPKPTPTPKPTMEPENSIVRITGLHFTEMGEINMKVGENTSPGCLKVDVKQGKTISEEDITFVSENPKVAEIKSTKGEEDEIDFEIISISPGETYIYAECDKIKTDKIHVIVSDVEVIYDKNMSINEYVVAYNEANPDWIITSEDLTAYHHHGQVHEDQANYYIDGFEIIISAKYGSRKGDASDVSVFIGDKTENEGFLSSEAEEYPTNEEYREIFKRFAKGFDNTLTNERLEQDWKTLVEDPIHTVTFDSYSCYFETDPFSGSDTTEERIEYLVIEGEKEQN